MKKIAMLCVIAGLSCNAAMADDLIVSNDSSFDSTTIINGGICSNMLGSDGLTKAGDLHHVIPEKMVNFACKYMGDNPDPTNCKADLYMTSNCGADGSKPVATVYMDITGYGIKSIQTYDPKFSIAGNGYTISIKGN